MRAIYLAPPGGLTVTLERVELTATEGAPAHDLTVWVEGIAEPFRLTLPDAEVRRGLALWGGRRPGGRGRAARRGLTAPGAVPGRPGPAVFGGADRDAAAPAAGAVRATRVSGGKGRVTGEDLVRSTAGRPAPGPPGRWWRPLRPDDPRDGWRPDPGVWLTTCPRHGPRADTRRRWEVCPVCHGPMGVDARRDAAGAGGEGRAAG
jgi:hypothetical protein